MSRLPAIEGQQLVKVLQRLGFVIVRTKGSHVRMRAEDGRVTTVPIHAKKILPKGLLRKIIREDLKMELNEFIDIFFELK
ncbi:MAG: type II toxin-antitoxin system HicA family toxin [Candidatus Thorarchaeota archaeon]|nr:type II toxin-antitoxin system HicA family toxin [Candidatus Thorarchaeota archaeon]